MFWSELTSECRRIAADIIAQWRSQHATVSRSRVMMTVGPGLPPVVVTPAPTLTVGPVGGPSATVSPVVVVGPAAALSVTPAQRAAWDERGWRSTETPTATVYEGEYTVKQHGTPRRFGGRVVLQGGSVTAYIANPPSAIRRHPKGPCFQLSNPPWFRVHWHRAATNVDDALLYVEQVLDEALN